MILTKQYARGLLVLAVTALSLLNFAPAFAADKALLSKDAEAALQSLYSTEAVAKALGDKAAGVLVFPNITKAGFVVGGSSGDGVLYKKGKAIGYYSSASVSLGFQAGVQSFGYAVLFMTDAALNKFQKSSGGWDVGAEANVVVAGSGASAEATAATAKAAIVAFVFDQKGLMGGVSLGGQKVTKIK
jgi:lipid-binding SYLF domain-containing protein